MKKYFVKETDEQVNFGDVISITIEKDIEFSEKNKKDLMDMEIIEERDDEMLDVVEDACPCGYGKLLDELCEDQEELEKKVEEIEEKVATLEDKLVKLVSAKKK